MIELSVAIPMYNTKNIGWLSIESLIRQKNIDFEWELVIAEEQNKEMMGEENIIKYKSKLNDVGCTKIKYIPLIDWIPLSTKWILMANHTSKSSKIYTFKAADTYAHPFRLKTEFDSINKGNDWSASMILPHYVIATGEIYLADYNTLKNKKKHVGMFFSTHTDYIKRIKPKDKRKKIDGWLFRSISDYLLKEKKEKIKIWYDTSDNWKYGFATHGLNNISRKRYSSLQKTCEKCGDLKNLWPENIINKLQKLKSISKLDW